MIFEKVNFNEKAIKGMSLGTFEEIHGSLWPDRDEATRKKMLGQVYEMINGPSENKKKKAEK